MERVDAVGGVVDALRNEHRTTGGNEIDLVSSTLHRTRYMELVGGSPWYYIKHVRALAKRCTTLCLISSSRIRGVVSSETTDRIILRTLRRR